MHTLHHPAEPPRRPLRRGLLALLVASVAAILAPSAAAAGCAKGTVRLTVDGTASCVRPAALLRGPTGAAALQHRVLAFTESAAVRRRLGGSAAYVPRVDRRIAAARRRAASLALAAARPSAPARRPAAVESRRPAEVRTDVKPLTGMPGWTGRTTTRTWDLRDDVEAFGNRGETVAERAEGGKRLRVIKGATVGGTLQRCPDANGTVRGTWHFGMSDGTAAAVGGQRAQQGLSILTTAEVTVHVADDASIVSYDVEIIHVIQATAEAVVDGRLRHEPTRTYRGRAVFTGLKGSPDLRTLFANPALKSMAMWGPKGRLTGAEEDLVSSFVAGIGSVFTTLPDAIDAVQRGWDRDAGCFDVEFTPPGGDAKLELLTGSGQAVDVRVVDQAGREVAIDLDVSTSSNLSASTARMHAPGALTLTGRAPSTVEFVSVDAVTRRGRISGTLLVEVKTRPDTTLRYRVLEAGFREQTVAERSEGLNLCRSIGLPIGGRASFAGASAGASDAEGTVRPSADGSLRGSLTTRMPATLTDQQLHGCQRGPLGMEPCATTLADDEPRPDGRWSLGIHVDAPAGRDSARVTLTALYPRVGFPETDDDVCNVYEITQPFPTDLHTADVPLSQLQGSEPFTVYLNGNRVWTTDLDGNPARIEFVWEYHVVLQRIP